MFVLHKPSRDTMIKLPMIGSSRKCVIAEHWTNNTQKSSNQSGKTEANPRSKTPVAISAETSSSCGTDFEQLMIMIQHSSHGHQKACGPTPSSEENPQNPPLEPSGHIKNIYCSQNQLLLARNEVRHPTTHTIVYRGQRIES